MLCISPAEDTGEFLASFWSSESPMAQVLAQIFLILLHISHGIQYSPLLCIQGNASPHSCTALNASISPINATALLGQEDLF